MKATLGRLPLSFEPNEGQSHPDVKFLSRGRGYGLFLAAAEAVLVLHEPKGDGTADRVKTGHDGEDKVKDAVVRMQFVGANPDPQVSADEGLPGKSNYFIGKDPEGWRTEIPHYGKVRYEGLYPGIDLLYYGNQEQLEYDWVVRPGADPERIQMRFEGARHLGLDTDGNLLIDTEFGQLVQKAPVIYQEESGSRKPISGRYVVKGDEDVSFEVEGRDPGKLLVIDPVLSYSYSSYLGGNNGDEGFGIAVDASGNTYLVGDTSSTNFPTASPVQPSNAGNTDTFVTKLNPTGSQLIYSTYLGGSGGDNGFGIAVDPSGNAYLTGYTTSSNFPTVSPLQASLAGSSDAFVAKLNPTGSSLLRSTYIGGNQIELGYGIALDGSGNAFVTGYTTSPNFPTRTPFQGTLGGSYDSFVLKMSLGISTFLVYSTYLGGSGADYGLGVAVDPSGSAYVTGYTSSTNFPTAIPFQTMNRGGQDAFITKLNAAGSALVYSTYLGGTLDDYGRNIAVDSAGSAYLTGYTTSTNFPTASPLQPGLGGSNDAFVSKFSPLGISLVYSTYLGGSESDVGLGIALDPAGNPYVTGFTSSTNFPRKDPLQATYGGGSSDAFLSKLNASGSAFVYSTFLGGSSSDIGWGVASSPGAAHVTGYTFSTNFPTPNAIQASLAGSYDGFVAKIKEASAVADYNADGKSDLLWHNRATGEVVLFVMNGSTISSVNAVTRIADTNWQIKGVSDYNGDGKADILWHHQQTGNVFMFLMDGATIASAGTVGSVPDTNWQVRGSGDYNADGKADIVWHHRTTGDVVVFFMNGSSLASVGPVTRIADTNWQIQGTGDYNGDGKADILWHHRVTGNVFMFLMDGATIASAGAVGSVPDTNWQVRGSGDYNGDGKADVVWHHRTSGDVVVFSMNGSTIASVGAVTRISDTNWQIRATGDYNGDAMADIGWHHQVAGSVFMFLMNGATIGSAGSVGSIPDTNWQIVP